MDNSFKVLETIGLQEVCKKTHIEVKQLEYIVTCQYDKLNRINTLGFIKILSREYKIDFSQWLEDFNDYWIENKQAEDSLQNTKIFLHAKSDRSYKKAAWLFLIFLLISGIFGVVSVLKIDVNFIDFLDKAKVEAPPSSAYQATPVVQEAATSLGVKVEERIIENNNSNTTVQAVVVSIDENLTRKRDANGSSSSVGVGNVDANATNLITTLPKNSAMIMPTKRIWLGTISLDTFTRKESINDKNISIDLTKRQIIKTGNGFFKLLYDGSIEDFSEQGSTRFLVENGTIKKISEEMFIELNKGKNW